MIECCLDTVCFCLLHDTNLGPTLPAGGPPALFVLLHGLRVALRSVALRCVHLRGLRMTLYGFDGKCGRRGNPDLLVLKRQGGT